MSQPNAFPPFELDELEMVATFLLFDDLAQLAQTSRLGRAAAKSVFQGCDFGHVPEHMSVGGGGHEDVCEAFALTPTEVKQLPFLVYSEKRDKYRRGKPDTALNDRIYDVPKILPKIIEVVGGWPALKRRLETGREKQEQRLEREKQRREMQRRREAAIKERWRALDALFETDKPLGSEIRSVAGWIEFLKDRGLAVPASALCPDLFHYLYGNSLRSCSRLEAAACALTFNQLQLERLQRGFFE